MFTPFTLLFSLNDSVIASVMTSHERIRVGCIFIVHSLAIYVRTMTHATVGYKELHLVHFFFLSVVWLIGPAEKMIGSHLSHHCVPVSFVVMQKVFRPCPCDLRCTHYATTDTDSCHKKEMTQYQAFPPAPEITLLVFRVFLQVSYSFFPVT